MKNGNEFLLTDTVGFIQKLPTMLVSTNFCDISFPESSFFFSIISLIET
jgi:hypothetical protein